MTALKRLERMGTCVHCMTDECALGYEVPLDCGYCSEYVSIWRKDKEVDDGMDMSDVQIYIPADKLWKFYLRNSDRCEKEMVLIAENINTEYAVYVTDDDGILMFSVCKGDSKPEYEEYALNSGDCANTAKKLFLRYLVPFSTADGGEVVAEDFSDSLSDAEAGLSREDMEDEMYEREDELDMAMKDFLTAVLRESDSDRVIKEYGQDFVTEVLNDILRYLAKKQFLEIYRPMFIEDEHTGCEIYTQFPYENEGSEDR